MEGIKSSYHLGLLLVTTSAVAWSTAGLFTRIIEIDTWTMLFWRGLFGAIGMIVVIACISGRQTVSEFQRMDWPGWIFAIVSAFGMVCFIFSLRITTVAHVSIIYATVPLVAAVLAWIALRERPSLSAIIASAFAVVGVIIMVGMGAEGDIFGDFLAFIMTLVMAIMMVISRKYPNIPIMPAACMSAVLSGLAVIPMCDNLNVNAQELGWLFLFGIVNSALGLSLFSLGARMLPAVETALIGALDAPLAPIWVWLIFTEIPSIATLSGGLIVFAAVAGYLVSMNTTVRTNRQR